ncbi:MAG: TonB-dependent siderophore receptor [Lautropia sp.]|nr:TonB-dependent siderophore receptor [Lautropia sp.]
MNHQPVMRRISAHLFLSGKCSLALRLSPGNAVAAALLTVPLLVLADTGLAAERQPDGRYRLTQVAPSDAEEAGSAASVASKDNVLTEVRVRAKAVRYGEETTALPRAYAGGQVARGSRVGMLGNMDFMETPFSTTAYTTEHINDIQARDIGSVIGATDASVAVPQSPGVEEFFMVRGLAVRSLDISFNGLTGMAPFLSKATELAERIEVQKGPSAMLSGMTQAGGVGGSINIVSKRAGAQALSRLTTSYDSDGQLGVHADIGRRFGDRQQFGVRFNGVYRNGDTPVDDQRHKVALGALGLDWRGDHVRLSADIYRHHARLDGADFLGISNIASAVTRLPDPFKGKTNLYAPWQFANIASTGAMVRAEWDVTDHVMAYAAYGRRNSSLDTLSGSATLRNDAGDISDVLTRRILPRSLYSAEAGVQGRGRTGPVRHEWALAATTYHNETKQRSISGSTRPDLLRRINIYMPDFGVAPDLSGFSTSNVPLESRDILSSVALANRMFFLDERMELTLGIRRQLIKAIRFNAAGVSRVTYDQSAVSPSVALLFKATPQFSVYGNYIEGLNQGSTAPASAANANEVQSPYKTKQYELGTKYDFGDVAATVALFQITRPTYYTSTLTNIFAANGEQRNRGLELSLFGQATRGLRLMGGMTLLDATQRNQLVARNNGNQVTGVPRFVARGAIEYDVTAVQGMTLMGLANYVGRRYATDDNRLSQAAYATVDVGARYAMRVAGKPVTLRASVNNLGNVSYWAGSSRGTSDSGLSGGLGAPRTFALSASVDF